MAITVLLLLSPLESFGRKPIKQLTLEEVAQVWVGLSEDELDLFRLDLHQDGVGEGGFVFAGQETTLFHISRWSYDGKRIEVVVSPPNVPTTGFSMLHGELVGSKMELTISGPDWRTRVHLRQESELERRWLMLREAMSSATNWHPLSSPACFDPRGHGPTTPVPALTSPTPTTTSGFPSRRVA